MILLRCFVHLIDVEAHPSVPAGFRWAVQVGDGPPEDAERCANAGWCPSLGEARMEGDQNAATATRVLRILGLDAQYAGVVELDADPIPPNADRLNVV